MALLAVVGLELIAMIYRPMTSLDVSSEGVFGQRAATLSEAARRDHAVHPPRLTNGDRGLLSAPRLRFLPAPGRALGEAA